MNARTPSTASALGFSVLLALTACEKSEQPVKAPDVSFQKDLQLKLIQAKPGEVIELPAGHWTLDRSLSLNIDGVTVKGAGMDKTVLSFKGQVQGAEGLIINANATVIEDLAIEDSKGDGIKVNECQGTTLRRIRVEWTNGPDEHNGSYGLYPVQCQNVLIENSVVKGASDAGIYVGQSKNIVVRNNRVEFNVAGIEIENSRDADVYGNSVTHNTGGILVFNLPDLPIKDGRRTRVHDNHVFDNNTRNFAPKGNTVAVTPAGTGLMVLANDQVELFNNKVENHKTVNALVVSYGVTGFPVKDPAFDAWPESVYIHDNQFGPGGDSPDNLELKALRIAKFGLNGRLPDIVWDGAINPALNGALPEDKRLCIQNNHGIEADGSASFANIDHEHQASNLSTDIKPHDCALPHLAEVSWPGLTPAVSQIATR